MGRKTAKDLFNGTIRKKLDIGIVNRLRIFWHWLCRILFSLDLPREEHEALKNVHFRAEHGMIGILGPNGAGKTTLLRSLAAHPLNPLQGLSHLAVYRLKR